MLNFRAFEMMKEKVEQHKDLCEKNNELRAAARKELNEAKAEKLALLDRQIAGESVVNELTMAKVNVEVAEEKYNRLIAKIGETNPELNLKGANMLTLTSEIRNAIASGRLVEETMKDEMGDLIAAKNQYLEAAEKILIKFHQVEKHLLTVQKRAAEITGESLGLPVVPSTIMLRPALWVDPNDYNNEFYKVKYRADAVVNGKLPEVKGVSIPDEMVLKEPETPTETVYTDEDGVQWQRQAVGFKKAVGEDLVNTIKQ